MHMALYKWIAFTFILHDDGGGGLVIMAITMVMMIARILRDKQFL